MLRLGFGLGFGRPFGAANDPSPTWTPASLTWTGNNWVWYDPADLTTLFADRSATPATPASVDGVVGTIKDKSGNGLHAIAPSDGARSILRQSGALYYIEPDGLDDCYVIPSGANGIFRNAARGVIAAAARAGGSSIVLADFFTGVGSARALLGHSFVSTGPVVIGRRLDSDGGTVLATGAPNTNDIVTRGALDWTNSDLFLYVNGSLAASNTSFSTSGNTENTDASVDNRLLSANGSGFWSGRFYGLVAGQPASISTDMDKLDAYLAAKMGL